MNWITEYVRPKLRTVFEKRDTPDNLWSKCPSCGEILYEKDLLASHYVCSKCDYHFHLSSKARLAMFFDAKDMEIIAMEPVAHDPLRFKDQKRYADRLKEARKKTGSQDAVTVVRGTLDSLEVMAFVQDFSFMGGSMGMATGEAFIKASDLALVHKCPLIAVTAAGGARMQEGILSLMQMPRTTLAVQQLREAGLPYIVVLTHPTTGGVTASYGMLGDIHIAEPGALIGFTGPRVIAQTIKQKLPEGFQRAEYLHKHGMVDMVVHRQQLKKTLSRVLHLLMNKKTVNTQP